MKTLISYLFIIVLTSCKNGTINDRNTLSSKTKSWTFLLADSLTKITMNLPKDYDTLHIWTHRICGIPYYKARIQSKLNEVYQEGGFYDIHIPTDKNQITFVQQAYYGEFVIPNRKAIAERHKEKIKNSENDPQAYQSQFDTLLFDSQNTYSIISDFQRFGKENVYLQTLETEIYSRRGVIRVIIEQAENRIPLDRTKFIYYWIDIIKTIRIKEGI